MLPAPPYGVEGALTLLILLRALDCSTSLGVVKRGGAKAPHLHNVEGDRNEDSCSGCCSHRFYQHEALRATQILKSRLRQLTS